MDIETFRILMLEYIKKQTVIEKTIESGEYKFECEISITPEDSIHIYNPSLAKHPGDLI